MQIQYWIKKLNPDTGKFYTEQEAAIHIKSFRKSNIEYWLKRGYSVEDAKKLRSEYQKNACQRGVEERRSHPEYNTTSIEYWLAKGYSKEEASEKLSERQRTFTLEKCIKKYGKIKGTRIYKNRQIKWQNTLNLKSDIEKKKINIKRNMFLQFYKIPDKNRDEAFWLSWKKVCDKKHMIYADNIESAKLIIETAYENIALSFGKNINWFLKNCCPHYVYKILRIKKSTIVKWLKNLNTPVKKIYQTNGKYHAYHIQLDSGDILLSKLEIIFYNMIIAKNIQIDSINGKYPNSNFRFDFQINGKYIEIAGLMPKKLYRDKMLYKRDTFGCFILTKKSEFVKFIQKVLIENDEKTIQYYLTRHL